MSQISIPQALSLAMQQLQGGALAQAEQLCRQILQTDPANAQALHLLGLVALAAARPELAIDLIGRAISLGLNQGQVYVHLGNALCQTRQWERALAAYQQAIGGGIESAELYNNLGNALTDLGRLDQAVAAYRRAIALAPNLAAAYSNLGTALHEQGQLAEAAGVLRHAIALDPNVAEAYSNLGNVLAEAGELEVAIAACRRAIELRGDYADAWGNLGNALYNSGHIDQAIAAYRRSITHNGNNPQVHYNLALPLLCRQYCEEGFNELEWRWFCKDLLPVRRNFTQPMWDGSPLQGQTILLHGEQGFGDTLHFIRYVPIVAAMGGQVIVEVQSALHRLTRGIAGASVVVARGESLPHFDVHCPLMSLPRAMKTTVETIPGNVPYLHADAADIEKWRDRLGDCGLAKKIGLAWAGQPKRTNWHKSMSLAQFTPLAQISGVRFFSLQKGAAQNEPRPPGLELMDLMDQANDFADTAALIANLDLVISVDTAVIHLAGAMAKPVWTLLPFVTCWRWLRDRADTPWYPTMRLFRQPRPGDWESVMEEAAEALQFWIR